jgi:predicted nucleotidyltransferase
MASPTDAIGEFKNKVSKLYGQRFRGVILYGSWARGDATDDSDIDLAVMLSGKVSPSAEIDRMIDIITDVNLEYGVLLSIYPVSEADYAAVKTPLLINLRREGVPA